MCLRANHTALGMCSGSEVHLVYAFPVRAAIHLERPNSFREVQFSTMNEKHLFVQGGICMFTEKVSFCEDLKTGTPNDPHSEKPNCRAVDSEIEMTPCSPFSAISSCMTSVSPSTEWEHPCVPTSQGGWGEL